MRNFIKHYTNLLKQLLDIFTYNTTGDLPFGNVIWFLTSLFFVKVILKIIKNKFKDEGIIYISILTMSAIGIGISYSNLSLILGIDSALVAIGFYYFGYCLNKFNFEIKKNILNADRLYIILYKWNNHKLIYIYDGNIRIPKGDAK